MLANQNSKITGRFKFKPFERQIILKLTKKHHATIENKKLDPKSNRAKQKAWEEIYQQYNRNSMVQKVEVKQLKRFWENTKARNKIKNEKQHSILEVYVNDEVENIGATVSGGLGIDDDDDGGGCGGCGGDGDNDVNEFDEMFAEIEANDDEDVDNDEDDDETGSIFNQSSSLNPNAIGGESIKQFQSTKQNHKIENDNSCSVEIEKLLNPLISSRLKKFETQTNQQNELHQLQIQREQLQTQREQLQIHALKQEIARKNEEHTIKLERDRQLHELKMTLEKDLYMQRLRNDQEFHQQKLSDYNQKIHGVSSVSAVVASPYPNMYK